MHLAKGLEFKAVLVMACDDEALPLQSRIDEATDEDELREVFETERHLFYVACTRARDRLHITGVKPVSDFVADLVERNGPSARHRPTGRPCSAPGLSRLPTLPPCLTLQVRLSPVPHRDSSGSTQYRFTELLVKPNSSAAG